MKFNFTDQTVLITGSSRGIGKATAIMFAEAGAKVIVHYNKNKNAADSTFRALPGDGHQLICADLSKISGVKYLAKTAIDKTNKIDILVNNAGIYIERALQNMSFDEWTEIWEKTIQINLNSVAAICYFISKHMIDNNYGKIINITSRGAFRGEPNALAYGASKAGLNSFSQSLAKTLAPHNIYVYAIAPGFVETDMASECLKGQQGHEIRQQSPLNRVAQPEEIAHTILMTASNGNEYMTGAIIDVNGASYLRN